MKSSKRFAYIDSVRGIAILGVISVHCVIIVHNFLPWHVRLVFQLGAYGVQLFFVASAVTLLMSLKNRKIDGKNSILNFYLRRFFRVAPMFYAGILFYSAIRFFGREFWDNGDCNLPAVILTILFQHTWDPSSFNSIVPGGWSIGTEFAFYMIFPILCSIVCDLRSALMMLALSIMAACLFNELGSAVLNSGYEKDFFLYSWLPNNMPAFAIGFATFYLIPNVPNHKYFSIVLVFISIFISILVAWSSLPYYSTFHSPFAALLPMSFCSALLVCALAAYPLRWFVNPIICHIGKVSFSAYLTHWIFIAIVQHVVEIPHMNIFYALTLYGFEVVFVTICTVSLSTLTYMFVEKPMIALGNRLIERGFGTLPVSRYPVS